MSFEERCKGLIAALGLGAEEDVTAVTPLTGGVASDIARVDVGDQAYCVKFALAKLKVAEDWHAPVHRNAAEFAWLQVASSVLPETGLKLFGRSDELGGFAMEFLSGESVYLWKDALLKEQPPQDEASQVGSMLSRIHSASAKTDFDRSAFDNMEDFTALRLEPYLTFTASRYPDLAHRFHALANSQAAADQVLIHGDVSPKNILVRDGQPVILDAECATMGDASFDLAFCLNHLVLKALHLPDSRETLLASAQTFWEAYSASVDWEDVSALETRLCALLPALMLARVDGKSPVEYLSEAHRQRLREMTPPLILEPLATLSQTLAHLRDAMKAA